MVRIKLASARKNADLSQQEVADQLGISRNTISNWERYLTTPTVPQAEQLAALYNIPIENIIFSLDS